MMRPTSSDGWPSVYASPYPTRQDGMPLFKQPRSPYYYYVFYVDGIRYRASTKKTTRTAAAQVEAEARTRIAKSESPSSPRCTTLRLFSIEFLKWVENTTELEPNSKRYYKYGVRLLNISPLAPRRLDTITPDEIGCTVFRRPRRKEPNTLIPCSTSYTLQALRTLKVLFGKAVEWMAIHQRPRVPMPSAIGRDLLIDDHVGRALDTALNEPIKHRGIKVHRRRTLTVLACIEDGGMRPNEVFPMRIENLYFDKLKIWVPIGKTANARRWVNMSDRMAELLKEQVGDRKSGFVLESKRSKCGHLTTIAKGFQAARRRAKVAAAIVPYSGRHTFGTLAMEATGNVFAVSKAMGHGSIRSMEPYQHPNPDLATLNEVINQKNRDRHTFSHTDGTVN